ncbi:MAG TPA: protocatechuate 3,4-dioxygenase subunit alpha [Telluria sp.]|nr:protocatechuate 3,4-dioxygenase subunit alpha [Telluria sp.]
MSLQMTASQTVGPFLHIGMDWLNNGELAGSGERIVLEGQVRDAGGAPVPDAVIEIWQANAGGRYAHPDDPRGLPTDAGFAGFGRLPTDAEGCFRFGTVKPGRVPGPGGSLQAPHIVVLVFMRGLLKHLVTRVYFPGDPANGEDPVLKLVPSERRATLVAQAAAGRPGVLEWTIRLQGDEETVFFDV